MHCKEYQQLLSGHLDGTNSAKEEKRLQGHLKTCKHCRELLAQMEANELLLKDEAILPPPDLKARIMAQVRKEPRKRPNYRRLIPCAAAGLAAAAMLTLVFAGNIFLPNERAIGMAAPAEQAEDAPTFDESRSCDDFDTAPTDAGAEDGTRCFAELLQTADSNCTYSSSTGASIYSATEEPSSEPTVASIQAPAETEAPTEAPTEATAPPETAAPAEPPTQAETTAEPTVAPTAAPTEPPTEAASTAAPPTEAPTVPATEAPAVHAAPEPPTEDPAERVQNDKRPPKRGMHLDKHEAALPEGPVLVLWDASDADLAPYADLEAAELSELPNEKNPSLLYSRFLQALPLLEPALPSDSLSNNWISNRALFAPEFSVVSYKTSYETFLSVLSDFAGKYELAAYYPKAEEAYQQALVLVITNNDT